MAPAANYPVPPIDPEIIDKWDKEWMHYLSTELKWPHLLPASRLKVIADISEYDRRTMFDAVLTRREDGTSNGALRIWAKGSEIAGKNVAEIGCGAGFLGKQLGLVSNRYLGIDVSQVALAIARGNSGTRCRYLHLSDKDYIVDEYSHYDAVVGREFFIHQNFENAIWVLELARNLLAPGGVVCADFYLPNAAIPQGIVHPAKSQLDPNHASCGFVFSDGNIDELARLTRLNVVSRDDDLKVQRKLVVFQTPS
jgi:2-polyprenyl-3-methyl-5-hydroxy-6-metoxy-1,4-benzoquinol methylase